MNLIKILFQPNKNVDVNILFLILEFVRCSQETCGGGKGLIQLECRALSVLP